MRAYVCFSIKLKTKRLHHVKYTSDFIYNSITWLYLTDDWPLVFLQSIYVLANK